MKKNYFLYLIIFLEGYVVLSTEILAIRQILPFVGGSTEITSIVIAAVLLPLALGYYMGGRFKKNKIRAKLLQNIFISTCILVIGLSYILIHDFFQILFSLVTFNRVLVTTLYSIIFIVVPVFLLAQTIPLVSHYFKTQELPSTTGKMLFFSTLGSLMGAILPTLVFMATIGVNLTVTITITLLSLSYLLLTKKKFTKKSATLIILTGFTLYINSHQMLKASNIIESNQYHNIKITDNGDGRRDMILNKVIAAGINYNEDDRSFAYIEHIKKNFIAPLQQTRQKKSILVIGTGGFTVSLKDQKNDYIFIDIDGSLKDISEKYFLKRELGKNKQFIALPARAYLQKAKQENKKFDFIFLDAYLEGRVPDHLATKEFFGSIKDRLENNGILTINIIASPSFSNPFSINIDNTLRSVFPNIGRDVIGPYNPWNKSSRNLIYSYYKNENATNTIYTDDKNRVFYDKGQPVNLNQF